MPLLLGNIFNIFVQITFLKALHESQAWTLLSIFHNKIPATLVTSVIMPFLAGIFWSCQHNYYCVYLLNKKDLDPQSNISSGTTIAELQLIQLI